MFSCKWKNIWLHGLSLSVAIVHTSVPSRTAVTTIWWGYGGERSYKLFHNKIMWTYSQKLAFFHHLCLLKLWHLMGYCPSFCSDILINSHSPSDSIITDSSHISCTNTQLCSQRLRNLDYASKFQFNIHSAIKMARQVMKEHQVLAWSATNMYYCMHGIYFLIHWGNKWTDLNKLEL